MKKLLIIFISCITLSLASANLYAESLSDIPADYKVDYKSAIKGDAESQFNLGYMYDNGDGVAENKELAVDWYRKSAEQGYSDAQYNLAYMYDNGEGVAENKKLAADWYRRLLSKVMLKHNTI